MLNELGKALEVLASPPRPQSTEDEHHTALGLSPAEATTSCAAFCELLVASPRWRGSAPNREAEVYLRSASALAQSGCWVLALETLDACYRSSQVVPACHEMWSASFALRCLLSRADILLPVFSASRGYERLLDDAIRTLSNDVQVRH